jgi:small subunit ribosomal protein S6
VNCLKYETLFIIRPDASEETVAAAIEKAQEQVTRNEGIIVALENWGRRKLAYEIDRFTDGIFVKMDFEMPGDTLSKLTRHFMLSEEIIRHQTVKPPQRKSAAS